MTDKIRASLLSLTIIAVIVFSAFGTTTVYADGGAPPDTPPTETSTDPDSAVVEATSAPDQTTAEVTTDSSEATAEPTSSTDQATEEAASMPDPVTAEATDVATVVTEEAASTPDPVTVEATDVASVATEEATSAGATAEEATVQQPTEEVAPTAEEAAPTPDVSILNEVPADTTVTVLDANGQSQPLATQEAADAIATTSDPVWCPGTQAPTPGANGCTDSFTSFDALLTFLSGNATYQGAGTIYVQQGAYQGNDPNNTIDFNSYNLSNISSADLTITGGWNTNTNVIDPATTSNFTNTSIIIGSSANPWGGSLTLNNISMSFDTNFSNNASNQAMNGLTLSSQSDVNLSNVSVRNAPNDGADINAGRDTNVIDSNFERNQQTGMLVKAGRNVNIANSSFSNPTNGRRQETGLDITSGASTSLFNVLANGNRVAGTNINATGQVAIGNSFFSGTKLMQGSGASTTFLGYGLQVVTPDIISLDTVTANDNFLWGASLQAGGNIAVSNSIFNANTTASPGFIDDTGLIVKGGANVALNNIQANDNRLFGTIIDATGTVSINNSTFSNNAGIITTGGVNTFHGHGLQVTSLADIFINNVTASNNMLFGAQLHAGGQVAIANSAFSNTSTGSSADLLGQGLEITSAGNASLLNVVLDNNQTVGASIQAGGDVFLDTVTATNNGSDGVVIQGICTSVTGGTYSGNGQYGLNLGNSALDLVTAPTFGNNAAGDMFPANPASCALAPTSGNTTGSTGSTGSSNVIASPQITAQQSISYGKSDTTAGSSIGSGSISLNDFLSNLSTTTGGIKLTIFTGKYAYIYSSSGIQVVALTPSSNLTAMAVTYRGY